MKIGSVQIEYIEEIDYYLDEKFKPGIFLQTNYFLNNDKKYFTDIYEHFENLENIYFVFLVNNIKLKTKKYIYQ